LAVAVCGAVLTGALLVGDSVRGSLRDLTLDRLGRIDVALLGERFFREDLPAEHDSTKPSAPFCCAVTRPTERRGRAPRR